MANPKLFRTIDRAVSEYNMIENGDRILIAASGGKDSTALAEYFSGRIKRCTPHFEISALHIAADIGSGFAPELQQRFEDWGINLTVKRISVIDRLKTGKKMNCWWCSSQRRLELSRYAQEYGFNKIALGHHLDDILETILMNALTKGELGAMPPVLKFDKFPLTFIRPLCLADTAMIIRHAEMQGYISSTCTCTYQENSGRKTARSRLDKLTDGNYTLKRKLFDALRNLNYEYLP
ncbi:MAG: tRNA 2-thiocytidine biosynthesis TtcA family protein [Treponema sp.]